MPCADTTQYAGHTAQFPGLSPEDPQVRCAGSCLRDVPEATGESHNRGQHHAYAQQLPIDCSIRSSVKSSRAAR